MRFLQASGLDGGLEDIMGWLGGPQEAPPNPAMNIQQGDPQVAVMLQHKSNLKTFLTKYSSTEKRKKNAPICVCRWQGTTRTVCLHLEKTQAEHDPCE